MSTPNLTGEAAYRYEAVYAFFPEDVVGDAEGKVEQHRFSMSQPVQAPDSSQTALVLRQARCRIPASVTAKRLIRKRLMEGISPPSSWRGASRPLEQSVPPSNSASTKSSCGVNETLDAVYVCSTICVDGDCREWECGYVMRCVQKEDESSGGGGGSCDSPLEDCGDDPNECNNDGQIADDVCEEGGDGGGGETTERDTVHAGKLCFSDPLKKMEIRATGCTAEENRSVKGGRFGCTRPDGDGVEECGPGEDDFHGGFDAKAEKGTNLYSPRGGTVVNFGDRGKQGWGKFVLIKTNAVQDGEPVYVVYAHLSSINVGKGQSLTTGDKVAETGVSGNAAESQCDGGPAHVHIETKSVAEVNNQTYNDANYFDPEKFLGTEFGKDGDAVADNCS